jgi:hypothetical protein
MDAATPVCGQICEPVPALLCRVSRWSCAEGSTPVCLPAELADPGIHCGVGMVCDGSGACTACESGGACTVGCFDGTFSCADGSQQCDVSSSTPISGRACIIGGICRRGLTSVCAPDGECVCCADGIPCVTESGACNGGHISCAAGGICVADGAPPPAGTTCGDEMICDDLGACVSCIQGTSCTIGCAANILGCAAGPICGGPLRGPGVIFPSWALAEGTPCIGDSVQCVEGDVCETPTGTCAAMSDGHPGSCVLP